jgi:Flp pilus assembly protein CpaB
MAATALSYPRAADTSGVNYARAIFGLAVALVGAALVLVLYVRGQPQTVQVLEAARDLPPGAVLQPDDLVAQAEPLSDGLAGLVVPASDRAAVIGHPIADGLLRGMPLARAQVLDAARRIPDDLRVVALAVTPESAAGGQIEPGDDVEILATTKAAGGEQTRTVTVPDRVQVYAVGVQAQPSGFGASDRTSSGRPLSWISVLATADQARAIASARATSDLQVNLLPPLREASGTTEAGR